MSLLDNVSKQALRLAAVGALLHNLGKIHAKFLDNKINGGSSDYLYQHILGLITSHINKADIPGNWQNNYDVVSNSSVLTDDTVKALKIALTLPSPLNDRISYTVGDLIEYLGVGVSEPWYKSSNGKYGIENIFPNGSRLTHLMNRSHRGASGGEKEDIATAQQPDASNLYLSTPFGYETAAPNINTINNLLQQIEAVIQKYLASPTDPLPLADLIAELRPLLSQAIADTQRPINDVTVGDIGHTGMAFLLTQAVEWILTGRAIGHDELAKEEADNTLLWRVLTIYGDSLRYLEEAASLADLRVRQKQLQDGFQQVSQTLQETLLAVEIYADEQCRIFVFPNLDESTLTYQSSVQAIKNFLHIDGLSLFVHLSEPVTNHPKDKNGKYIGDEVLKQLQQPLPYRFDAETITAFWSAQGERSQSPICIACNVRPQGYGVEQIVDYKNNPVYYRKKAEERNICCVCMNRRTGVAQNWSQKELNTTVWLDEVADNNGRLALIVGQFDINKIANNLVFPKNDTKLFLEIELVGGSLSQGETATIRGNSFAWSSEHEALIGHRDAEIPSCYQRTDLFIRPLNQRGNFELISLLPDNNYEVQLSGGILTVNQVYQIDKGQFLAKSETMLITQDEAARNLIGQRFWSSINGVKFVVKSGERKEIIADSTRNYSFARLRRIWQTTQRFWQTVFDKLKHNSKPLIPAVCHRLQIIPANRNALSLGHYHTYDLKLTNSVKLSVVWDSDNKRFITCDNLAYSKEQLGAPVLDFLKGDLTLEEPSGYGSKNKQWGKITIEKAEPLPDSQYTPTIPILAEPRTFMALVPADKALAVIDAIKTKYEREMGKVRNRLPLHLGAVYFHRRTPLSAALDAGRRMLKRPSPKVNAAVKTITLNNPAPDGWPQSVTATLQISDRQIAPTIPSVMGDGTTQDVWYPYWQVKGKPTDRTRWFAGADGEHWVHLCDLKTSDIVNFTPATFDFEWLDSSAQRFTIAYDPQTGQRRGHPRRPYLLDDLVTIQKVWQMISEEHGLTSSQIYALRDLVEAKREEWRPTPEECKRDGMFWRFCNDAVTNANWGQRPPKEKLQALTDWIVSSLFTDVVQLQMGIMKHKPQREEQNHE